MLVLTALIIVFFIALIATYKKWFLPLWLGYEYLFERFFKLKTIDPNNPFFHYRVRPYQGRSLPMGNGEQLNKGDLIAEIHFDNRRLYELGSNSRSYVHLAIRLIRLAQYQLPIMDQILQAPEYAEVKAVYGISMIHRGVKQVGFQVLDMPKGPMYFFTLMYLRFLVGVIHPSGRERLKMNPDDMVPKIMVHPTSEAFPVKKRAEKTQTESPETEMDGSISPA